MKKRELNPFTRKRAEQRLKELGVEFSDNDIILPHVYQKTNCIRIAKFGRIYSKGKYIGIIFKDFQKGKPYLYNYDFVDVVHLNYDDVQYGKLVEIERKDYLYLDIEIPQNVGFNWEKFYHNDDEEKAYDNTEEQNVEEQSKPEEDSIFSALKALEPITINLNINVNFNNTDG